VLVVPQKSSVTSKSAAFAAVPLISSTASRAHRCKRTDERQRREGRWRCMVVVPRADCRGSRGRKGSTRLPPASAGSRCSSVPLTSHHGTPENTGRPCQEAGDPYSSAAAWLGLHRHNRDAEEGSRPEQCHWQAKDYTQAQNAAAPRWAGQRGAKKAHRR
jgi:hypothetical protein